MKTKTACRRSAARGVLFLLSVLLFPLFPSVAAAQHLKSGNRGIVFDEICPPVREIDRVRLRVNYTVTTVTDTVSAGQGSETMVLDIGETVVKYYAKLYSDYSRQLEESSFMEAFRSLRQQKDPNTWYSTVYEAYYFNLPENGRETVTGRIGAVDFTYEEPLPEIAWQIEDSTRTLGRYTAQKATCRYKGRDYTAWFTPEIPVPYGPWEFRGLPGLILSVRDAQGHYSFTAESVLTPESASIVFPEYDYLRTNREKYLEMKALIEADFPYYFSRFKGQSNVTYGFPSGYTPQKLGNDFIERL